MSARLRVGVRVVQCVGDGETRTNGDVPAQTEEREECESYVYVCEYEEMEKRRVWCVTLVSMKMKRGES